MLRFCFAALLCGSALWAQTPEPPAASSSEPAATAATEPPNPFLGEWKENFPKSGEKQDPGDFRIRIYQDGGNGLMLHSIIESASGKSDFTFAAVHYDGREFPVYESHTLGAFLEDSIQPNRTAAYFQHDPHTLEWTERVDGKLSRTAIFNVSADGKTLTETVKEFDKEGHQTGMPVYVYDKQ